MYIVRDRFGIRPLCFGEDKNPIYIFRKLCSAKKYIYQRCINFRSGFNNKISNNIFL